MDLLEIIRRTKKDYSKYLIHFTKQSSVYTGEGKLVRDPFTNEMVLVKISSVVPAIDVLTKIAQSKKLSEANSWVE